MGIVLCSNIGRYTVTIEAGDNRKKTTYNIGKKLYNIDIQVEPILPYIEYPLQLFFSSCWVTTYGATIRFLGGGGGRSICRAENCTFCYMFIWNSSWSKLFISRRVRPKLFISKILLPPPPPWESNGGPLRLLTKSDLKKKNINQPVSLTQIQWLFNVGPASQTLGQH